MNPFIAFTLIWTLVIGLHASHVLYFYEPFSITVTAFLALGVVASLLIVKMKPAGWMQPQISANAISAQVERMGGFRDIVLVVSTCIFAFELFIFKGVPLLWLMTDDPRTYADFGIPTLHGIFNAFLLFVATVSGGLFIMGHSRPKNLAYFAFCLFLTIILYSRAMVFVIAIQMAAIILFRMRKKLSIPNVSALLIVTLIMLFCFGVAGNARVGCPAYDDLPQTEPAPVENKYGDPLPYISRMPLAATQAEVDGMLNLAPLGCNIYSTMVDKGRSGIFRTIPTEFLWFYAYSTSGLNNLIYNVDKLDPGFLPRYTFAKLLPTAVYSALGVDKAYDSFELAHPAFTVSTAYSGFMSDFGVFGLLAVIPLLLISYKIYVNAAGGSVLNTLLYATFFQSIILNPFVDTVMYATFMVQILLLIASAYLVLPWPYRVRLTQQ